MWSMLVTSMRLENLNPACSEKPKRLRRSPADRIDSGLQTEGQPLLQSCHPRAQQEG